MLKIIIPKTREQIERQIKALRYLIKVGKDKKDREIHQQALIALEKALGGMQE